MSTTFTARLNRLFDTVYPPGRGPHTSAEVIAALRSEGITMSAPYLSQLRSGNRTNPSSATMKALANFFRIKPAYFTDDEYYEKLDQELTWLANMRDEGVRRIAARTVGLSVEAQDRITKPSTNTVAKRVSTASPPLVWPVHSGKDRPVWRSPLVEPAGDAQRDGTLQLKNDVRHAPACGTR